MLVRSTPRIVDILKEVWRPLLLLAVLDCLVTAAYVFLGWTWIVPKSLPLPLLGTGLALFLGLRNNAAYDRWWEARTLWGAVVNSSRSMARSLSAMMTDIGSEGARRRLIEFQIAWVHALRIGLRKDEVKKKLAPYLDPPDLARVTGAANAAFAVQTEMAEIIGTELKDGRIDSIEAAALNSVLNDLANAQGGLERIRNTPMPRQYATFPSVFVSIYCVLLPFGFVPDLNLLTPVGSAVIGFLFLALDMSGRHLEDPFARSPHDIPMTAICRTIEIDLKHSLGEDKPRPLKPVFGVLR